MQPLYKYRNPHEVEQRTRRQTKLVLCVLGVECVKRCQRDRRHRCPTADCVAVHEHGQRRLLIQQERAVRRKHSRGATLGHGRRQTSRELRLRLAMQSGFRFVAEEDDWMAVLATECEPGGETGPNPAADIRPVSITDEMKRSYLD